MRGGGDEVREVGGRVCAVMARPLACILGELEGFEQGSDGVILAVVWKIDCRWERGIKKTS